MTYPALANGVAIESLNEEQARLRDVSGVVLATINLDALEVVQRCDGTRSIEDIAASLKVDGAAGERVHLVGMVRDTVNILAASRAISLHPRKSCHGYVERTLAGLSLSLPVKPKLARVSALFSVAIVGGDSAALLHLLSDNDLPASTFKSSLRLSIASVLIFYSSCVSALEWISDLFFAEETLRRRHTDALLLLSQQLRYLRLFDEQDRLISSAVVLASQYNDQLSLSQFLHERALSLIALSRPSDALRQCELAMTLARKSTARSSDSVISEIAATFINALVSSGDLETALMRLREYLPFCSTTSRFWISAGNVHFALNRRAEAHTCYQMALLAGSLGTHDLIAFGELLEHRDYVDLAYICYDTASNRDHDNQSVSVKRRRLGMILENENN